MLIEVKVSGFDIMPIREVAVMSQKMAGFVLASMADLQRKCFRIVGFECWVGLCWTILFESG